MRRRWLAFPGALVVSGCGNLLGLSDYEARATGVREAGPAAEFGFLSAPDCTRCIADKCATLSDACEADATCRDLRACRAACRDPICHEECAEKQMLTDPWVTPLSDLYDCVRSECDADCKPGRHWDCVCNYSAPGGYSGTIDLQISIASWRAAKAPVEVRACPALNFDCSVPVGHAEAETGSVTSLEVLSAAQGFAGSIRVSPIAGDGGANPANLLPTTWARSIPLTPRVRQGGVVGDRETFDNLLAYAGFAFDPSRAYASIFLRDCEYTPGASLVVEPTAKDDQTTSLYWRSGVPNVQQTRTTSAPADGLMSLFVPAPAGPVFVARDADSGKTVGSIALPTFAGVYSQLVIYPLTRDQGCQP